MTSKATPLKIELVNDPQQLWFSGKGGAPITLNFVNNDTRFCEKLLVNVVRADLLLKNELTLTASELQGGGHKLIDEGWFQCRFEAPMPWEPIDDWDTPFDIGTLWANGGVGSCEIRLNPPVDNVDYGRICFAIMISAKMANDPVVYSCTINQESFAIATGEQKQATATVVADFAVDTSVIWSIDKPEIATVDVYGLITGIGAGRAILTARSTVNPFYQSSRFVRATLVPLVVYSCSIDQASFSPVVGETQQATATVVADPGADLTVTWSVAGTDIATVDATGLITGVAEGTTTITATSNADPAFFSTKAIETQAVPVPSGILYRDNYESYTLNTTPPDITYINSSGTPPAPKVETVTTFYGAPGKALTMLNVSGFDMQDALWISPTTFNYDMLVMDCWLTMTSGVSEFAILAMNGAVKGNDYILIHWEDWGDGTYELTCFDGVSTGYHRRITRKPWARMTLQVNMQTGLANLYVDKVLTFENIVPFSETPSAIRFSSPMGIDFLPNTKFSIDNAGVYANMFAVDVWAMDVEEFIFESVTQTITGYAPGSNTEVTIPATIDSVSVIKIATNAFPASGITSVIIPASVLTIEPGAFTNPSALVTNPITSITIGANVTIADTSFGAHAIDFEYEYIYTYASTAGTYIFSDSVWVKQ